MADEPEFLTTVVESELAVRSLTKREIEARIVPWNVVIDSPIGPEMFVPGSFGHVDPRSIVLRLEHADPAAGVGTAIEERSDGAWMTFRVSRTDRGDEILTLAADGVTRNVSVGFDLRDTISEKRTVEGRRVTAHTRAGLREVSTTWKPAYRDAVVMAVRSEGEAAVEDTTPEVIIEKEPTVQPVADVSRLEGGLDKLAAAMERMEERFRSQISIPGEAPAKHVPSFGEWGEIALKILSGERIPEQQFRTVADVISTDNAGVVPDAYSRELIGVIDASRPFLASTRRLSTPASGMSLVVPVINTRPTTAVQSTEKTELSSTATNIGTKTFDMVTIGGVGDISLQLIKRADRSFVELYIQLLAEAYAIDADAYALRALFDAAGGIGAGVALDPEDLELGAAFAASFDTVRRAPDTIWLSTDAIVAFIDAKNSGTNAPLYSNITSNITAGGGPQGSISGLRAVHTPALDTHGAFAVVGPSNGFAWAEDGTYTLQVDVPSKAGRDVALVGMLWFAPWYPDAFTIYNVAS